MQANVAKQADIQRLFAEAKKAFGTVDILVNNAGIYEFAPIEEVTAEHFHKLFDLNVLGLILASQEAVKALAGGGSIINISSVVSHPGPAGRLGLQRHQGRRRCRDPVARQGAGSAEDPGQLDQSGDGRDRRRPLRRDRRERDPQADRGADPLGRIGQPQDIAPAAVFLASADSAWITGETFYISGGWR